MIDLLDNTIMPYAWGSHEAIAALVGRPPSREPEAELWMGAHPVAPSRVVRDGQATTLDALIARDPEGELGRARSFGRLPFLVKILAASQPLSLQAHPNAAQAKAGFADEDARGIPRDAGHRSYKDASHKPELLCALGPFDALCGFRLASETRHLFDALAVRDLDAALAPLRAEESAQGLAATFRAIMTTPDELREHLVRKAVAACETLVASGGPFVRECRLAARLAELYPGDVGAVSALLLNLIHLEAGEAVFLGAGNLHAYLGGMGVEVMASSDNVLRGGLTKKHIDVPELMRVLDFRDGPVTPLAPTRQDDEDVYVTPAREFRLSRVKAPFQTTPKGPEILLTTEGTATITSESVRLTLPRGASAFVSARTQSYAIGGDAVLYRAGVND